MCIHSCIRIGTYYITFKCLSLNRQGECQGLLGDPLSLIHDHAESLRRDLCLETQGLLTTGFKVVPGCHGASRVSPAWIPKTTIWMAQDGGPQCGHREASWNSRLPSKDLADSCWGLLLSQLLNTWPFKHFSIMLQMIPRKKVQLFSMVVG